MLEAGLNDRLLLLIELPPEYRTLLLKYKVPRAMNLVLDAERERLQGRVEAVATILIRELATK